MSRLRRDRSLETVSPGASGRARRDNAAAGTTEPVAATRPRLTRQPQPAAAGASGRPRTSNAADVSSDGRRERLRRGAGPHPVDAVAVQGPTPDQTAAPVVRVEAPSSHALVVSFAQEAWPDCERELASLARDLGDSGAAVVVCRIGQSGRDAGSAGADRLVRIDHADTLRQRADILAACRRFEPARILLPHSRQGAGLARYLAAALGIRPALGVAQIRGDHVHVPTADGRGEYRRPFARIMSIRDTACRSAASRDRREARPIDLGEGATRPAGPTDQGLTDRGLTDLGLTDLGLTDLGLMPADVSMLPLEEAAFIVSAGDGVTDFDAFERTARSLSATIAGSRVVCDAGHLPRDRQIGASGHVTRAECYVALGISGAPQHLEGIRNCTHVVAVNTDLHAAMVERADLAIIADAQSVMAALLRARGGHVG